MKGNEQNENEVVLLSSKFKEQTGRKNEKKKTKKQLEEEAEASKEKKKHEMEEVTILANVQI